jgi:hypothetical protein
MTGRVTVDQREFSRLYQEACDKALERHINFDFTHSSYPFGPAMSVRIDTPLAEDGRFLMQRILEAIRDIDTAKAEAKKEAVPM